MISFNLSYNRVFSENSVTQTHKLDRTLKIKTKHKNNNQKTKTKPNGNPTIPTKHFLSSSFLPIQLTKFHWRTNVENKQFINLVFIPTITHSSYPTKLISNCQSSSVSISPSSNGSYFYVFICFVSVVFSVFFRHCIKV